MMTWLGGGGALLQGIATETFAVHSSTSDVREGNKWPGSGKTGRNAELRPKIQSRFEHKDRQ